RGGRRSVGDLHADRKTDPTDVDDRGVGPNELADGRAERVADTDDPREYPLIVQDVEHGQRRHGRDGVPAECAEEHGLVTEPRRDLAASDDRADRVAVAHRLADRYDVRQEAQMLERPHVMPGPP